MALTKESEDAFRQCLRILSPRITPAARRQQIINLETYIKNGKWIPTFNIKQIAHLFYPHDATLEMSFLGQMEKAIEAQELLTIEPGNIFLLPSNLAAWFDCPPVPQDSPLRYWLPGWMQASALPPMLPIPTDGEARLPVLLADTQRDTSAERAPPQSVPILAPAAADGMGGGVMTKKALSEAGGQPSLTLAETRKQRRNMLPEDGINKRADLLDRFRNLGGKRPDEHGNGQRGALSLLSNEVGIHTKNLGEMLDMAIKEAVRRSAFPQVINH